MTAEQRVVDLPSSAQKIDRRPDVAGPKKRRSAPEPTSISDSTQTLNPEPVVVSSAPPADVSVLDLDADPTTRVSLVLDVDQVAWLHKQADRSRRWPGEVLEALLVEHSAGVVQSGVPRKRRRRSSGGRSNCKMTICSAEAKRLDSAAKKLNTSMSAFVREVLTRARDDK